jgi:hypothetical protein
MLPPPAGSDQPEEREEEQRVGCATLVCLQIPAIRVLDWRTDRVCAPHTRSASGKASSVFIGRSGAASGNVTIVLAERALHQRSGVMEPLRSPIRCRTRIALATAEAFARRSGRSPVAGTAGRDNTRVETHADRVLRLRRTWFRYCLTGSAGRSRSGTTGNEGSHRGDDHRTLLRHLVRRVRDQQADAQKGGP